MDTNYFYFDENNKETKKLTQQEYRQLHDGNYAAAQTQEDKNLASLDYFHGIRAKTNAILPQKLEMEFVAGKTYKDKLTPEQRLHSFNNPQSEIYKKNENAQRILDAQEGIPIQADKLCASMAKKRRVSKNDLKPIALLYGKSKTKNTSLTNAWLNRTADPKQMLKEVLNAFLGISFDNLDLSTDKKLSKNAPFLESLCIQYDSIIGILTDYRDIYNQLNDESKAMVEKKIGEAGGLVNYYRLMKVVLTNPYYLTHENRELSVNAGPGDSAEKRRLKSQLWLAKGGLKALTEYGVNELNKNLEKLCGNLQTSIVTDEQLKVQDKLIERDEEIRQYGLSKHLDKVDKNKPIGEQLGKNEKTLFHRARKGIRPLELPDKVEQAGSSVTSILDQLQFIESFTADKIDHKNFYYLEHNYRDIAVVDQVVSLSAPLIELKKAVLSVCNITADGFMKTSKITAAKRKEAQLKYESALSAYKSGMRMVDKLRNGKLMPENASAMTALVKESNKAGRSDLKLKDKVTEKEKEAVREKIKDMMLTLSGDKFSDYSIYDNAQKIMQLNVERQTILGDADEFFNFKSVAFQAEYLWISRRRKDVEEALTQKELTDKEINDLQTEVKELVPLIEKKGELQATVLNAQDRLQRMRLGVEKDNRNLDDLKATASHYLFQEEWARNSNRKQDSWKKQFVRSFYSGITRFFGWIFSKPKTNDHGKVRYQESKNKLSQLPDGIEAFGNQGVSHTITHGDGTVAPVVELNKYFKDPMKTALADHYAGIRQHMADNEDYPPYLKEAVEALSHYTKVRGIVNSDTFEMEHAFLDTFRSGTEQMMSDIKTMAKYPDLCNTIMKAYKDLGKLGNGNLSSFMKDEELRLVRESKSIYTKDTYTGSDMKESNMQFLPLFPHEPNLNDIKQGITGDCYLLSAVQKVVFDNPQAIRDMFHDLGDGNVVVRFYAPFGKVTDSNGIEAFRRIDDSEKINNYNLRPVYVKVRKQYATGDAQNTDSMWVQLLEKAYAAAGFNAGVAEIAEDGELLNMNKELTDGKTRAALAQLTGEKYQTTYTSKMATITMEQSEIERNTKRKTMQIALLTRGIDAKVGSMIYFHLQALKKQAIESGELDVNFEEKIIREAVRKTLTEFTTNKEMEDFEDKMAKLKATGGLTDKDVNAFISTIKKRYDKSEERIKALTNTIIRNIKTPGEKVSKVPQGYMSLKTINKELDKLLKPKNAGEQAKGEQESLKKKVDNIINMKTKLINDLGPNDEDQNKALQNSVKNYMMLNPGNIYTQDELAILRLVREETGKGRALAIENDGHCMSALDTKLHNGKWFVLIRDPFNVFREEYKTVNGQIEKSEYALGSTLTQHFKIRNLSRDLKQGFLGTCWWELKDAAKAIKEVHTKVEEEKW
ncbi:C2 family cysteine protease [Butyrivibrio sp. FCS014]|uniref:C2 family cysteine protease n=1 Tax=Butyrivibrio sp. FCS014 TaxID=1408304 RepID=UPI0004630DC1|nr:C2 family cysteine protease [Butyrivibrio sp. FCS014]